MYANGGQGSRHPLFPLPPGPAASRSPSLSMDRGGWSGSSFLALVGGVIVTPWATATAATGLLSIYCVLDSQLRNSHALPHLILPEAPGGKCAFPEEKTEAQRGRATHSKATQPGSSRAGRSRELPLVQHATAAADRRRRNGQRPATLIHLHIVYGTFMLQGQS